jgi:low affinity Fe/Cu permease
MSERVSPSASADLQRRHIAWFSRFARFAAIRMGRPWAFVMACGVILVWLVTGPLFGWNETWQLVINTGTTIVTFVMIFLLQNSQNHDTTAMHIKLDEIIRAIQGAHNTAIDLEMLDEDELKDLKVHYAALAERARNHKAKPSPSGK